MNQAMLKMNGLTKTGGLVPLAKALNVPLGDYARLSKEQIIGKILAARGEADILAAIEADGLMQSDVIDVEPTREEAKPLPAPAVPAVPDDAAAALGAMIMKIAGGAVNEQRVEQLIEAKLAVMKPAEKYIVVREPTDVKVDMGDYMRPEFPDVLALASQGMNVMLVGPAGSGKSYFGAEVAKALGRPFSSNSCSAGMSESQLSGWLLPVEQGGAFSFVPASFVNAYENGGVHLIDEIDAADPNTLIYINQAIANGKFFVPQRHGNPEVKRHPEFVCLAAANTFGQGGDRLYVGREQLDAATLDRFWMVEMNYDDELEERLCTAEVLAWGRKLRAKVMELKLRRVVSTRKLAEMSRMRKSGCSMAMLQKSYFAPWSTDDRAKVGYTG